MEPEEIAVVLSRASELLHKLRQTIGTFVNSNATTEIDDDGVGSSEARCLAAICDALENLEEQLEALQALQQQQRAERDAELAAIEESRGFLLRMLREHKVKDLEIVQEALAFAGGIADEEEEEGTPPSTFPILEEDGMPKLRHVSIPSNRWSPGPGPNMVAGQHEEVRNEEGQEEDERSEVELAFPYKREKDEGDQEPDSLLGVAVNAGHLVRNSGAFNLTVEVFRRCRAMVGQFLGNITGQVTGPSSGAVILVVSALAVLSLTDLGERRTKTVSSSSKGTAHRSHHRPHPHPGGHLPNDGSKHTGHAVNAKRVPTLPKEGVDLKMGDDFPNCVVREHLELPFYQELQTPDVLHGRG